MSEKQVLEELLVSQKNSALNVVSDEQLISRYRSEKELEILGILYQRYIHLVYGVCLKYLKNREESKDIVMQIFEKLIEEIEKFDIVNFRSWLYVLTKHYCLRKLQKDSSAMKKFLQYSDEQFMESTTDLSPLDEYPEIDRSDALNKCIGKLTNEQRECIELFYFQKKCYQEISDTMDIPLKKVKSYIQNGKRNLKICIENENGQTKTT